MRRDSFTIKILSVLAHTEWAAEELWDALSGPPLPGAPAGKRHRPLPGYRRALAKAEREFEERSRERRARLESRLRYQQTISRLVRGGLVERVGNRKNARFRLSLRGIREFKKRAEHPQPPDPRIYPSEPARTAITIVSYDIPERDRWKRTWIRSVLVSLGYRMVHQSVWVGTRKLPDRFLKDARELGILHCMEIFEVSKTGTLRIVEGS
ncbi:MAG: hypothetical protein Q7S84_04920 [bacterium]|nr:hypothetical protein [bacterium]